MVNEHLRYDELSLQKYVNHIQITNLLRHFGKYPFVK